MHRLLHVRTFILIVFLVLSISSVSSYAEELFDSISIPLSFDSDEQPTIQSQTTPPIFPNSISSVPSTTMENMSVVVPKILYIDTYMSSDRLMAPLSALQSLTDSDIFPAHLDGAYAKSGNKIELIPIGEEYYVWLRAYAEYFGYKVTWQADGLIQLKRDAEVITVVPNNLNITQVFAYNSQPITIRRINSGEKLPSYDQRIALTFDDGPHPNYTPAILDILSAYDAKATFFEIGREARRLPELVKKVVNQGSEVGNHTFSHKDLSKLTLSEAVAEIAVGKSILEAISGTDVRLVRLPYGTYREAIITKACELGETVTFWSVDPRDWEEPGVERIVSRVLNNAKGGDVVLLHERLETIAALPMILDGLRKKGYKVVTVSELIRDEG